MTRKGLAVIILLYAVAVSAQEKTDTLPPATLQWTLSYDYTEEISTPLDTLFSLFHRHRITDKYSLFNAYPGNYGQPMYQISFFDRATDPGMFLYRYYFPFMHLPSNPVFIDTRVPFTEMLFTYAGPRETAEQTFRIRHSQNVNRFLNFGLVYDIVNSLGQYSYQRTDNKTFTFHSSYRGLRYKFYFAAGLNSLLASENGGIADLSQIETYEPRDVEVKLGALNSAKSGIKNANILLVQRYTLAGQMPGSDSVKSKRSFISGLNGTVSHILVWEKTRRYYSDNYPESGFYDTSFIFISKTVTFDSLSERSLKNSLRFDFSTNPSRKFRLGGGAGISNELFRYSQIAPSFASPPSDTVHWYQSNNLVRGTLFNDIGDKFRWKATGELYLTGFRAGDINAVGNIYKVFGSPGKEVRWYISGSFSATTPSVWYFRWGSNHYTWQNDFLKEFRITAGTQLSYPSSGFSGRFNYAIIDNYTDFDTSGLPSQHSGGLSVASLFIGKEFKVWKFHLSNQVLMQKSSNKQVLDLPLVTLRSAGFFEHNFHFKLTNGNLNTQIGAEVFYNTPYYGYGYNPATGAYFRQKSSTTGNYPYLNAFINVKIRRTRVFLMLDHFNSGMTGYGYFMVPGSPMNVRAFRYGIAWTFYD